MPHARPSNKDMGKVLKLAKQKNWEVTGGGTRHYRLRCPNPCGCSVIVASSTANQISHHRYRSYLRNHTCWERAASPSPAPKGA